MVAVVLVTEVVVAALCWLFNHRRHPAKVALSLLVGSLLRCGTVQALVNMLLPPTANRSAVCSWEFGSAGFVLCRGGVTPMRAQEGLRSST